MSKERFSTRLGLILSVLGIAIGTGNYWRFPRIAEQNGTETGAGAFLFAWVSLLCMWSLPLIIAEYGIGRFGRKGGRGSYIKLAGKNDAGLGSIIGFGATYILHHYGLVGGW